MYLENTSVVYIEDKIKGTRLARVLREVIEKFSGFSPDILVFLVAQKKIATHKYKSKIF